MKVDEEMLYNLSINASLIDPNGEIKRTMSEDLAGYVLNKNTVALRTLNFGGTDGISGITHGKYTLTIQVKDKNAGVQRDIQLPLEILPKNVFRLKSIAFVHSVQQYQNGRWAVDFAQPLFIEGVSVSMVAFVVGDTRNRINAEMTLRIRDDTGQFVSKTFSAKGAGTADVGVLHMSFLAPPAGRYVAVVKGWNNLSADTVEYELPFVVVPSMFSTSRSEEQ